MRAKIPTCVGMTKSHIYVIIKFMKQPRALIALSLTEMWERFGLYIIQGLLIFYMTKELNFPDLKAYAIMGQFTALVYISPILGGLCADRLLGFRHTILTGAFLLLLGYILLAFPFSQKEISMYLGLAVVILGNGFLKPNISSFLGQFYHEDDPRRDAGFTIYYMVFNLGITLSTLSSGYIQENFGWHVCFAVAAAGLLLAIGFFRWGYRYFGNEGLPLAGIQKSKVRIRTTFLIILSVGVCYLLLKLATIGNLVLVGFGLLMLLILCIMTFKLPTQEQSKMLALLILIVISIVFWAIFFQIFIAANLFIDRNVDRQLFGHMVPPVAFISLESLFIFLLSPLFAFSWKKLHENKLLISRGLQFTLGLAIIGFALQLLVIGVHSSHGGLINPWWIVICYFFITIGELMLSPIGLSMVTQLAPAKLVGLMMGVWFLGLSYGGLFAGVLGKQASISKDLIGDLAITNPIYAHAFQNYALMGFGAAIFTLALTPWLNRLTSSKSSN